MRSAVIHLGAGGRSADELVEAARHALGEATDPDPPDLICSFLPPGPELSGTLEAMSASWPESLRVGCEAVTQFAGGEMTGEGSVQLFWFDRPESRAEAVVVTVEKDESLSDRALAPAEAALADSAPALLLVDGLRFPAQEMIARLGDRLHTRPTEQGTPSGFRLAGGLASQTEPIAAAGARVFVGTEVLEGACVLVALHGIEMEIEVVRGWDPASPIYTVTAARDNVLYEIDGERATEWLGRFFTVDGALAPLPESAYRFPLIIDGPSPARRGLYRSMRAFDDPPGAVTFWGDLRLGDHVRIGIGNDASLLRTAGSLRRDRPAEAAVIFSCVGREAVLGDFADQEVATIHQALAGAALAGFFTFGEIGPSLDGGLAFYNHTAILALLRERAP